MSSATALLKVYAFGHFQFFLQEQLVLRLHEISIKSESDQDFDCAMKRITLKSI